MEICTNDITLCIVPKERQDELSALSEETSELVSQKLSTTPIISGIQLSLKNEQETIKEWTVDHIIRPDSTNSMVNDRIAKLALQGYDVSVLYLKIGDTEKLREQQQNSLHSLLGDLQANLIKDYTTGEMKLEYAYLEFSDDIYHDIRKEKQYSREAFIDEGGLDQIMKEIFHLNEVWVKVEQSSEEPYMLVIKLTNNSKRTTGRLFLVNLQQPESICTHSEYACIKTYNNLYDAIRSMNGNINLLNGHIDVDNHVIVEEFRKYICGQNKLAVYVYFNDVVDTSDQSKEIVKCLDMLTMLRSIPVKMIKNTYVPNGPIKFKNKLYIEQLKKYNKNLKLINSQLESSKEELNNRIEVQKIENEDLKERIILLEAMEKVRSCQIQYLKVSMQQAIKESSTYVNALHIKIDADRALIEDQMVYIEFLKRERKLMQTTNNVHVSCQKSLQNINPVKYEKNEKKNRIFRQ